MKPCSAAQRNVPKNTQNKTKKRSIYRGFASDFFFLSGLHSKHKRYVQRAESLSFIGYGLFAHHILDLGFVCLLKHSAQAQRADVPTEQSFLKPDNSASFIIFTVTLSATPYSSSPIHSLITASVHPSTYRLFLPACMFTAVVERVGHWSKFVFFFIFFQ